MSDDTQAALRRAEEELASARDRARTIQLQLLDTIASDLPAHTEQLARRTAHNQPEVTKSLGSDGVRKLRGELGSKAEELAALVREGVDAIGWPQREDVFLSVKAREVSTALFRFLYGRPVDSMATIFKNAGFNVGDENVRRHQDLVLPQSLFSDGNLQEQFEAVAQALNAVTAAMAAKAKSKAADDKAAVDELWG